MSKRCELAAAGEAGGAQAPCGAQREELGQRVVHRPPHDSARAQIQYDAEIEPALTGWDVP